MFIVFEGGEGAGKTSAIAYAAETLGARALTTREPGGTPEGLALRALLLAGDAPDWDPMAELLLMVAARAQHVSRLIKPALAAGQVVLCDRFLWSTLAYQGAGRGLDIGFIEDLHRNAIGLLPDLTVLLDVDPRVGLARSWRQLAASGQDEGRFEGLDLAFHERVRGAFLALAARSPSAVIDAAAPEAEVRQAVMDAMARALGE